ncbi:MAG: glucose-1-phosphate adenylyltransferase [Deltaproteobacteria bacterium]|nr:glucose-1-phosphate adenylyltransferase [Deltaproteobacteria bacterium]
MDAARVLAMVLAGGAGKRLLPLTAERAKPAVPFAGRYRLVDFVLSNLVNSGFLKIKVLTQYMSDSLNTHVSRGWHLATVVDNFVELVPAQQRLGPTWYRGSADALYQNLNMLTDERPDYVAILWADHVYKMDLREMLAFHCEMGATLTLAATPVPLAQAKDFGCITVDEHWRMIGYREKPADPQPLPSQPDAALASMGIHIFSTEVLVRAIAADAANKESSHDFGKDIVPRLFQNEPVYVYDFSRNQHPGMTEQERGYWRDVGTLHAYWSAHMDLVSTAPIFNLYNMEWPIHTYYRPLPPAKFVHDMPSEGRVGFATESMVSEGCIISGGRIHRSVLSPRVRINSYCQVYESILFDGVNVGRRCRLNRTIVDKGVDIPAGTEIGYDRAADEKRFHVDESGIVVVKKGYKF